MKRCRSLTNIKKVLRDVYNELHWWINVDRCSVRRIPHAAPVQGRLTDSQVSHAPSSVLSLLERFKHFGILTMKSFGSRPNEEPTSSYALAIRALLQRGDTMFHSLTTISQRRHAVAAVLTAAISVVHSTTWSNVQENTADNHQITYCSAICSTLVDSFTRWPSKDHEPIRSSQRIQPRHR